jgi:hypothetical protein
MGILVSLLASAFILAGTIQTQTPRSVFHSGTAQQNFTVTVGYTNLLNRAEGQAFFSSKIGIHIDGTITWIQNFR